MVGPGRTWVKAIVWLVCVTMAGCFWRSYAPRVRTHTEIMVSIARKAVDLVGAGRFTAESMPELTYPLERAAAFARQARERAGDDVPASLSAFEALMARYRALIDALDRVRRERRGAAATAALAEPLRALEEQAMVVYEALRREESRDSARHVRGISTTRLPSLTVASSVEIDCPSWGWITCGASSARGRRTKRRLCSSGCGIFRLRFSITS